MTLRRRALGVDLGSKRIGIAVGNVEAGLASPLSIIERSGQLATDHRRIRALAQEEEATCVVVGVPIALGGREEIAAAKVREEIEQLEAVLDVPIEAWDERMTSAAAHKNLAAQGVSSKKRRGIIDKHAAAVILQGWLDNQRLSATNREDHE